MNSGLVTRRDEAPSMSRVGSVLRFRCSRVMKRASFCSAAWGSSPKRVPSSTRPGSCERTRTTSSWVRNVSPPSSSITAASELA